MEWFWGQVKPWSCDWKAAKGCWEQEWRTDLVRMWRAINVKQVVACRWIMKLSCYTRTGQRDIECKCIRPIAKILIKHIYTETRHSTYSSLNRAKSVDPKDTLIFHAVLSSKVIFLRVETLRWPLQTAYLTHTTIDLLLGLPLLPPPVILIPMLYTTRSLSMHPLIHLLHISPARHKHQAKMQKAG